MELLKIDESKLTPEVWKLTLDGVVDPSNATALQSASWGLGQILGRNCEMAGFADVEAFVRAMSHSEDVQLAAVAALRDGDEPA